MDDTLIAIGIGLLTALCIVAGYTWYLQRRSAAARKKALEALDELRSSMQSMFKEKGVGMPVKTSRTVKRGETVPKVAYVVETNSAHMMASSVEEVEEGLSALPAEHKRGEIKVHQLRCIGNDERDSLAEKLQQVLDSHGISVDRGLADTILHATLAIPGDPEYNGIAEAQAELDKIISRFKPEEKKQ